MLIVGRSLQGVGAGGFMTLINIVVSDLFSMRYARPSCSASLLLTLATGVGLCFLAFYTQPGPSLVVLGQSWEVPSPNC